MARLGANAVDLRGIPLACRSHTVDGSVIVASDPNAVAERLHDWFLSVLRLTEESLFSVVSEGPHRDAVVLDALKRNARILSESGLDSEGKLYSPLCFFLAAACRKLGTSLGIGHWRAAVDNVVNLQQRRVSDSARSATLGLEIGSPAVRFKQEFDEAIKQAAVAGGASYLNREDRQVALGLAINWGMRLLLAYALECGPSMKGSDRRDLAWVANVMEPLLTASISSQ
ncbi:MAG: hypothetical protein ACKV2U_22125 [Bryobacteraceae bacterium]